MMRVIFTSLLLTSVAVHATPAAETSLQMVIDFSGDAERRLVKYRCDATDDLLPVEYLNAAPNFLAIIEVDGDKLIFVSTVSETGVTYLSGRYVWTTDGAEATLRDAAGDLDVPIATCLEANETP
jgi:membrane-bound inhibitor of C-type lysozyme